MWILIRWLHQKPADLDLMCFHKMDKSGLGKTKLITTFSRKTSFNSVQLNSVHIISSVTATPESLRKNVAGLKIDPLTALFTHSRYVCYENCKYSREMTACRDIVLPYH